MKKNSILLTWLIIFCLRSFGQGLSAVSAVKPYGEVITAKAKTQRGLFTVHTIEDRYLFEIADSLLGRDILIVNRIAKAAAETRNQTIGYAGDEIGENIIRFEKGPNDRLFMKRLSFGERSADSGNMYHSVMSSNIQPIIGVFPVKAYRRDSLTGEGATVIDMTELITGDNELFYFSSMIKGQLNLGGSISDRSYIIDIKVYPTNIELRALKTYGKGTLNATYELNSSVVLLPRTPMKARLADERIGYFTTSYTDFDANPQGIKKINLIIRWRMEPKAGEEEKYKRGELVEPAKPIIFYIDPSTPKKWVPYLIMGVNDWQTAFEKAGFKNAIMAREAPSDSDWSIDDARHSAIVYKPSAIPNAMGAEVLDPRSGEILEAHINWYHNIMKLVHDWYMIQAGATDPAARRMGFNDTLMGQLIRFVSSHEVGHTLGLMHNYGASSTVPVDSLRSKKWVEANGHTPSIMDYARFNYVAQPEDGISERGIFPRIGDYDRWAIQWGYTWMPEYSTAASETPALNKLMIVNEGVNKKLWFGSEMSEADPRCQNEDLGDNAMLAGMYGIRNLKRILPNLLSWTRQPDQGYGDAKMMYDELVKQLILYMGHVAKNIGGVYKTYKTVEQAGPVYENVPYERQKAAIKFLNEQLFTTPSWLIDKPLMELAGADPVTAIKNMQLLTLNKLFGSREVSNLIISEGTSATRVYTIRDLLHDLRKGIFSELYDHKNIDLYRRNLQKMYLESLKQLLQTPQFPLNTLQILQGLMPQDIPVPDISAVGRGELTDLLKDAKAALPLARGMSKYHIQDMIFRIDQTIKGNNQRY